MKFRNKPKRYWKCK